MVIAENEDFEDEDLDIDYPFEDIPEYGQAIEVARGILWVRMPLPPPLHAINLYLVREEGGWAIIDTGVDDAMTRTLWDQIHAEVLHGEPITRLILTHHHGDHAGLAGFLCGRWNLPMFASEMEFNRLHEVEWSERPDVEEKAAMLRRAGMPEDLIEWRRNLKMQGQNEPPPGQYHVLAEGDQLRVGQSTWEVLVGRGHTPEHACLYCADRRILIGGDQALPRVKPQLDTWNGLPEHNLLGDWLESTVRLAQLADDTLVLPSHNEPYIGLRARAAQLLDHHGLLLDMAEESCRHGRLSTVDVARVISPYGGPEYSRFLACGNAYAHLLELEARGRVTRKLDADGIERWQAASAG